MIEIIYHICIHIPCRAAVFCLINAYDVWCHCCLCLLLWWKSCFL